MNERSAVLIAAGLVLTLGIGGLAVSLGLTGPSPVNAARTCSAPASGEGGAENRDHPSEGEVGLRGDHHALGPGV